MNFKKTAARPNKCQQKRIGYNKEMQSGGQYLKKENRKIKVTVMYGEKKLTDCMKNILRKRTKA